MLIEISIRLRLRGRWRACLPDRRTALPRAEGSAGSRPTADASARPAPSGRTQACSSAELTPIGAFAPLGRSPVNRQCAHDTLGERHERKYGICHTCSRSRWSGYCHESLGAAGREPLAAGRWGVPADAGARFGWGQVRDAARGRGGFRYPKAQPVVASPHPTHVGLIFINLYRFGDGHPVRSAFQSGKAYGQPRRIVAHANDLAITYLGVAAACQLISHRPHAC